MRRRLRAVGRHLRGSRRARRRVGVRPQLERRQEVVRQQQLRRRRAGTGRRSGGSPGRRAELEAVLRRQVGVQALLRAGVEAAQPAHAAPVAVSHVLVLIVGAHRDLSLEALPADGTLPGQAAAGRLGVRAHVLQQVVPPEEALAARAALVRLEARVAHAVPAQVGAVGEPHPADVALVEAAAGVAARVGIERGAAECLEGALLVAAAERAGRRRLRQAGGLQQPAQLGEDLRRRAGGRGRLLLRPGRRG